MARLRRCDREPTDQGAAALVLVCPVNPYSAHGKRLAPFFATRFGVGIVSRGHRAHAFALSLLSRAHVRQIAARFRLAVWKATEHRWRIPGLFEHALSIVQTWTADLRELETLLPKLADIPTLLMWGTKDPAVYFSSMEPLARHFANVQTVVFPGVGHLPYEECPEEFNRALIKFLTLSN